MDAAECVLGVHLAAGTLWLALVAGDGNLRADRTNRLDLADSALGVSRALCELEDDLTALLRRLKPTAVAVLSAGSGRFKPDPRDSRRRGWLEAVVMVASSRTGYEAVWVSHDKVANLFASRPSDRGFGKAAAVRLKCAPPERWEHRASAYAAAVVVVEGEQARG